MLPGQGTSLAPCVSILNVCRVNDRFFFKDFIYLFLERGEGKEKETEGNINVWLPLACPLLGTWPATQACALTGNQTSDPLIHRPAFNPLSHISQVNDGFDEEQVGEVKGRGQSTESWETSKPEASMRSQKRIEEALAGVAQWVEC